jgi:hypothetical protein
VTVRFTGRSAAAFPKIEGRKVRLTCTTLRPPTRLFPAAPRRAAHTATAVLRVPRHGAGHALTFTLSHTPGNVCELTDDGADVAGDGLTRAGRDVLANEDALFLLFGDDPRLTAPGGKAYRSAKQIAAAEPRTYVALATPGAAAPVGRIGVWTDQARRAVLSTTSATGHRYVMQDEGDGVLRSNVFTEFGAFVIAAAAATPA